MVLNCVLFATIENLQLYFYSLLLYKKVDKDYCLAPTVFLTLIEAHNVIRHSQQTLIFCLHIWVMLKEIGALTREDCILKEKWVGFSYSNFTSLEDITEKRRFPESRFWD